MYKSMYTCLGWFITQREKECSLIKYTMYFEEETRLSELEADGLMALKLGYITSLITHKRDKSKPDI